MSVALTWSAVLTVGLGACIWDLRTGRIPNALTFGAAAGALVLRLAMGGVWSSAEGAAGWLVGTAMLLPLFALGGLGGGDVKLLAAIGAWLGPSEVLMVGLYGAVAGGLLALGLAVSSGVLRQTLGNINLLLSEWRLGGLRPVPSMTLAGSSGLRVAYSVPITVGAGCVWLLR